MVVQHDVAADFADAYQLLWICGATQLPIPAHADGGRVVSDPLGVTCDIVRVVFLGMVVHFSVSSLMKLGNMFHHHSPPMRIM